MFDVCMSLYLCVSCGQCIFEYIVESTLSISDFRVAFSSLSLQAIIVIMGLQAAALWFPSVFIYFSSLSFPLPSSYLNTILGPHLYLLVVTLSDLRVAAT